MKVLFPSSSRDGMTRLPMRSALRSVVAFDFPDDHPRGGYHHWESRDYAASFIFLSCVEYLTFCLPEGKKPGAGHALSTSAYPHCLSSTVHCVYYVLTYSEKPLLLTRTKREEVGVMLSKIHFSFPYSLHSCFSSSL